MRGERLLHAIKRGARFIGSTLLSFQRKLHELQGWLHAELEKCARLDYAHAGFPNGDTEAGFWQWVDEQAKEDE